MDEVKYFANFYKFTKNNALIPIGQEVEIERKDIFKVCIPKNADFISLCEKQQSSANIYSKPVNIQYYCVGTILSAQEAREKFGELSTESNFITTNNLGNVILLKDDRLLTLKALQESTCLDKNSIDEKGFVIDNREKDYLWLE